MKPEGLTTKIFLDGGDPAETEEMLAILGFLDGQTTNPTLIAKNPEAAARLARGEKFSEEEIYSFYKGVVSKISSLIPGGSVSIEVYADKDTPADTMLAQGKEMFTWIPNAHVKYPVTPAGLQAAHASVEAGMRVNMTLVFNQTQAAAVYAATFGAPRGSVFLSPFVGRLDDKGENGMDLIKNIMQMYAGGDGHVEVLAASVRSFDHFMYALALKTDIITAPAKILKEWAAKGMPFPEGDYAYDQKNFSTIAYEQIPLSQEFSSYSLNHELTAQGVQRFSDDWNALIKRQ